MDLAVDVWNDVRNKFLQGDKFRIATLQEEIHGLKVRKYDCIGILHKIEDFWEEQEMFEPLPQCYSY